MTVNTWASTPMCRDVVTMAIVLPTHKMTSTAETTGAYGLAMMCNAVHMHNKLTLMNKRSTVNRLDATLCMVNTWETDCLCLNRVNG